MKDKKIMLLVIVSLILIFLSIIGIVISFSNKDVENNLENKNTETENENDNNNNEDNKSDYLIIENTDMLIYENNSFRRLNNKQDINREFNIFINKEYFGKYYLRYLNNWNIFDENDNYYDYEGSLIAYTDGINVKIANFNILEISEIEKEEISNIDNNIIYNNLTINEKVEYDLDNNGYLDKIVNISNLDSLDEPVYFNLIYLNLNGEISVLMKQIVDEENVLITPIYTINQILNINNNEYYDLLFKEENYSNQSKDSNILYEYDDGYKLKLK